MKKNNIIILSILIFFVIVVIITLNFALKNMKYTDNTLTLDNLTTIESKISERKIIKIKDFEKYKLDNTKEEGSITTYFYNVNDKYKVEVIARNELVIGIKLINKVTEVYVDIMNDSLEEFLAND